MWRRCIIWRSLHAPPLQHNHCRSFRKTRLRRAKQLLHACSVRTVSLLSPQSSLVCGWYWNGNKFYFPILLVASRFIRTIQHERAFKNAHSKSLPVCSSSSSHNYKSNHLVLTPIIGYWSTAPHQPPLVVNMTGSNQVEFGEMETELNRFNQRQLDWIEELPSWNSIKWNHRSVRCCCQVNDGQTDR